MVRQMETGMRFQITTLTKTIASVLLAWLLAFPGGRACSQEPVPPDRTTIITAETTLVTLTATVSDSSGRNVANLQKDDFKIYEDGVAQQIGVFETDEVPVSVGILFDTSGSMVDKIDDVEDAVIHYANTVNPDDDIFLMQFSTKVFVVQDFTNDRQRLRRAVKGLRARGSTALYEAIAKGLDHVQKGKHKKKALVVITDGNDTSSHVSLQKTVSLARRSEVLIYCLGIGHGEAGSFGHLEGDFKDTVDADALLSFSDETGGKTLLLQGAHYKGGVDQIDQASQEVAAELRQQYTLGYYPSNRRKDGTYRRIRVEVEEPELKVRARTGYIAPLEPTGNQ